MPIETRLLSNADLSQIHPMKQEVHYFYGQVPHPSLKTVSLNKIIVQELHPQFILVVQSGFMLTLLKS